MAFSHDISFISQLDYIRRLGELPQWKYFFNLVLKASFKLKNQKRRNKNIVLHVPHIHYPMLNPFQCGVCPSSPCAVFEGIGMHDSLQHWSQVHVGSRHTVALHFVWFLKHVTQLYRYSADLRPPSVEQLGKAEENPLDSPWQFRQPAWNNTQQSAHSLRPLPENGEARFWLGGKWRRTHWLETLGSNGWICEDLYS